MLPFSFLPALLVLVALAALVALAMLLAFETALTPQGNAHDGELALPTGRGAGLRLRVREVCGGPLALMLVGLGLPLLWPEPEAGVTLLAVAAALRLLRAPAVAHAMTGPTAQPTSAQTTAVPGIAYAPVAHMRTPFTDVRGMPIQPVGARGVAGCIDVLPEFAAGLADIEGFSHLLVIYHLHECQGFTLRVKPFLDNDEHGVFATRSPRRPNPIGISVLRLTGVRGNRLHVENVDMLDGTPVLDIKPYVPTFDVWDADRTGWFATVADNAVQCRADDRFIPADTTQPQTGGAS